MDTYTVEYTYTCGHNRKFTTPGIEDPAGIYADTCARGADDVIRVQDLTLKCYECDPESHRTYFNR